ncbi:MAG TPA: hypothetical protein VFO19_01055 [Vicinamibacterales bacterium]|nr:hypothetical protein [Vicinamibacterales bacterium]
MKRAFHSVLIVMLATTSLVIGQANDVAKILAEVRAALGGEAKLAQVKSVAIEGKSVRPGPDGSSRASAFEMAMELPDKFSKKEELGNFNGMAIARTSGFNGDGLVEIMDTPPHLGGGMVFMRAPGSGGMPGEKPTPEQVAEQRRLTLLANKKDFARLTLGMFASSFSAYPVQFVYAGQAEAPEGKADVLEVSGDGNFKARLFIDARTRLPLMLSWMDKEPLQMSSGNRTTTQAVPGGGQVRTSGGGSFTTMSGTASTPEEMEKLRADMAARLKEAEAKRRVVEYRLFYGEYKAFDGVRLPTRVQRMIDGNPTEELELEKVKVNARIDPKRFEIVKDDNK